MMHDSLAAAGIRALAPAVICVGCLSAFRGYAQGHGNMTPTAVSQILEALCKLVIGLGLGLLAGAGRASPAMWRRRGPLPASRWAPSWPWPI